MLSTSTAFTEALALALASHKNTGGSRINEIERYATDLATYLPKAEPVGIFVDVFYELGQYLHVRSIYVAAGGRLAVVRDPYAQDTSTRSLRLYRTTDLSDIYVRNEHWPPGGDPISDTRLFVSFKLHGSNTAVVELKAGGQSCVALRTFIYALI